MRSPTPEKRPLLSSKLTLYPELLDDDPEEATETVTASTEQRATEAATTSPPAVPAAPAFQPSRTINRAGQKGTVKRPRAAAFSKTPGAPAGRVLTAADFKLDPEKDAILAQQYEEEKRLANQLRKEKKKMFRSGGNRAPVAVTLKNETSLNKKFDMGKWDELFGDDVTRDLDIWAGVSTVKPRLSAPAPAWNPMDSTMSEPFSSGSGNEGYSPPENLSSEPNSPPHADMAMDATGEDAFARRMAMSNPVVAAMAADQDNIDD